MPNDKPDLRPIQVFLDTKRFIESDGISERAGFSEVG
jgi:hypothetical protein